MGKYPKLADYEGALLEPDEIFRFACCDCGLVHDMMAVREKKGKIGIAFRRHNRATAQLRRHEFGNLQKQAIGPYHMKRNR